MDTPNVPASFVPTTEGETIYINGIKCRIQEDGSRTDNRVGMATFTIPPRTPGPPAHWHQMQDHTFYVTKGEVRFHLKGRKYVDAKVGDIVVVPPRSPYTFENVVDRESEFFNVFTPAVYIQYFRLLAAWNKEGKRLDKQTIQKAMACYATFGVQPGEM